MFARPFIDSVDFALNGREISGEVPVAEMSRLLDALDAPLGILSYTVRGGLNSRGDPLLEVRVEGQCRLRCQRCLSAMDYAIGVENCLVLRDQASLDALGDEEDEECDSILADKHLDVLNLLEDEILLSLPIAPKHEEGACRMAYGESGQREDLPFAALAKLKVVK